MMFKREHERARRSQMPPVAEVQNVRPAPQLKKRPECGHADRTPDGTGDRLPTCQAFDEHGSINEETLTEPRSHVLLLHPSDPRELETWMLDWIKGALEFWRQHPRLLRKQVMVLDPHRRLSEAQINQLGRLGVGTTHQTTRSFMRVLES
jgi:hypothetical protein